MSLPDEDDEDVVFLDAYAETQGYASRSAVLHKAVRLLRASELGPVYESAWAEWSKAAVTKPGMPQSPAV